MTADELAKLKRDLANIDECNHNYDVDLARVLNAAPALIALAEWAERARSSLILIRVTAFHEACVRESVDQLLSAYLEGE